MTDKDLEELRQRNAAAIEASKRALGRKWCLHPANSPLRQTHPKQYPSTILRAVQLHAIMAGRL